MRSARSSYKKRWREKEIRVYGVPQNLRRAPYRDRSNCVIESAPAREKKKGRCSLRKKRRRNRNNSLGSSATFLHSTLKPGAEREHSQNGGGVGIRLLASLGRVETESTDLPPFILLC